MPSIKAFATRENLTLVADAFLMTAAAFGLVIGVSTFLIAPDGEPTPQMEWLGALGSLLSMWVILVVPVLVWVGHGRPVSLPAVLGAVLGAATTGIVLLGVVALSALLSLAISPFWAADYAGPLLMLIVIGAACVATLCWLVVVAVRDLVGQRSHPWRDSLRLVCCLVLVGYAAGVGMWITDHPGDDSLDALVFALVAGITAALAVFGAEILTAPTTMRKEDPDPTRSTTRP